MIRQCNIVMGLVVTMAK